LALLSLFIKRYPDDFDKDISLNNLASWGEVFCIDYWEEYAESILLPVMQTLELPAYWISHIANEKSLPLRKAFLRALSLLAREKDTSVDEVLGMLEPFLDESSSDARQVLVSIFEAVAAIDQKRLSLFMMESEKGAGLNRQTLLGIVRAKIKEK
jgi:hypothetical protein